MNFSSITQRFVAWFMAISLLPLLLAGYNLLHNFEAELKKTVARQISAIADKKVDQIDAYLHGRVHDALLKTQESSTRLAMSEFAQAFARSGPESEVYRRLDSHYRDHFRRFITTAGYYDLFLISPQGTVVYSQTREADFATNLITGPYRNTGLAKVTRNSLSMLESSISEYEFYAPSGNAAAAFIAVPILIEGKLIGVLALQIDNAQVFQVLLDRTGLGDSGETLVARREDEHTALVMAPLKSEPDAALKRKISLGDQHHAAPPLIYALNGERGSGYEVDYLGKSVLAAWRYLPRMGWGMVVKMDSAEALAPLHRVRSFALVVIGLALVAALLGALLLGRRVVVPLKELSSSAQDIAAGKFDQRVPVAGRDELGQLATSFNTMAERLQSSYANIEGQVAQRTGELTRSLVNLRIKDAAIATSINAIAIAGLDGKLTYVNQAFVELWHLQEPEDVLGHLLVEFWVEPEEAQVVMETLQQQGRWRGELRARLHDGALADLLLSAHLVVDEAGKPVCMMGSFLDVTARKLIEQELQKSEALLNTIITNMPTMMFVKRASDLRFEKLNRAGEELLGFSEQELLGKNDYDLFPREQADFFSASDREVLASHQLKDIPRESILTSKGETRILHTRKIGIYNSAGEPTHLLGVSVDITEQIHAEEALFTSTENLKEAQRIAQIGSWELDLIKGELTWSDQVFNLFEIDKNQFGATYEAFLHVIHPDDRALVNHAYTHSLESRLPYEITHRLLMDDGRIKWVEERCNSDFDAEGKPVKSRGTVQDITAIKLVEIALGQVNEELERRVEQRTEMLNAAKKQAEQANKAKSLFLSSMSHELRTPLNAVLGYAQLIEMNAVPLENQAECIQEIKSAGHHLLALVNDVLDLARIESGRQEIQVETFELEAVIADCQAQNFGIAQSRNILFIYEGSCDRFMITSDRRRLLQILNNLVSNAIKYNRENGSVILSCCATKNSKIRILVTDTGMGLSPDKAAQLFQPFNRLGAEMGTVEGTGIGLVITRRLVEEMGGEIGFKSTPGVGSEFWVELPGDELQSGLSAGADPAQASGEASPTKWRVLVVEDYEPNQTVLKLQLGKLGCEVEIASNGAEALEKSGAGRYDLIFSDMNMPVMGGVEFTHAVRQREKENGLHVPIIAITAAVTRSESQRCRAAGMDDVLPKPIALEDLQRVISRWMYSAAPVPVSPVPPVDVDAESVFDIGCLYRILGQVNTVHAHELVALFIRSATEGLAHLSTCTGDGAAVVREMHKQKTSARTVGALRYATLAEALEHQAKAGGAVVLQSLHIALAEFKLAAARLGAIDHVAVMTLPEQGAVQTGHYGSVLVIDDDPVVLQQMSVMLSNLGVQEVLTADNGLAALEVMNSRVDDIELLVCDLNMPEMDGVQLIRQLNNANFRGGLILMSGADEKILSTVSELAELQGVRMLGQAQKPVMPAQMAALLVHLADIPATKRQHRTLAAVTAEAIREGIDRDEFTIWFQPKVDALSLRAVGVEALARWRRPDGVFVPPDAFIIAAEQLNLIGELSQILVSKALMVGARLFDAGFPMKIAVNLSGRWLDDLNLPDFIMATVLAAGLKSGDVVLEVTETGVMEDLTTALDVLSRLRLKGFGLSIDDFGIGYSSFEQLGRIPFTELKLDRSFVIKGNQDVAARAILEGSMDMARKLALSTVAEGVETKAELELVRALGCDAVQGYLLAKPMPIDDLLLWLKSNQEENQP